MYVGYESLEDYMRDVDHNVLLVGDAALSYNNLVYTGPHYCVATNHKTLDGVLSGVISYEFYHFKDFDFCRAVKNGAYVPSPEKAIIDTIVWLPENMCEGSLIEALQTYQSKTDDRTRLYEVADFYKVPREFVDYWWREAEEESDMSMG